MPVRTVKGSGKKSPLNMRTTKALRKKLETAAGSSGRSLVQEVEYRLEQSFAREDFGRPEISTLMWQVYDCCVLIEAITGKNCLAENENARALLAALAELVVPAPRDEANDDRAYHLGRIVADLVARQRTLGDLFFEVMTNDRLAEILKVPERKR